MATKIAKDIVVAFSYVLDEYKTYLRRVTGNASCELPQHEVGGGAVIIIKDLEGYWNTEIVGWDFKRRTSAKATPLVIGFAPREEDRQIKFRVKDLKAHELKNEDLQRLFNNPDAHLVE